MGVEIQIHTLAKSFALDAGEDWCISNVKQEIEKLLDIPAVEQKLLQAAQLLTDIDLVDRLERKSDGSIVLFLVRDNTEALRWIGLVAEGWKAFCRCDVDGHMYVGDETPEWVWKDRRIVMAAIQCWHDSSIMPDFMKLAADHIKADKHVILLGAKYRDETLEHAADELKADRCFMIDAINLHPHSIRYALDELWNDRSVVQAALRKDYRTFEYAGHEKQHDVKFILFAVKCDFRVLTFVEKAMLTDKDFLLSTVKANWRVLKLTQSSGWREKTIRSAFGSDDSIVLCKLTKLDNEYGRAALLDALRHDWQAIRHALDVHISDTEIVLAAAMQDSRALQHVSPEIYTDQEFMVRLMEQVRGALAYIPEQFQENRNLVMLAVERDGCALQWAGLDLKADHEIAMIAVNQNWRALEFVAPPLKSCRVIVQTAAKQTKNALRYADPSLRDWKQLRDSTMMDDVIRLFRKFDTNGDGYLSIDEFSNIFVSLGAESEELVRLFKGADVNEDGLIDYEEFLCWIAGSAESAELVVCSMTGRLLASLPAANLQWTLHDILPALEKEAPPPDGHEYVIYCCEELMLPELTLFDYGLFWRRSAGPLQAEIKAQAVAKAAIDEKIRIIGKRIVVIKSIDGTVLLEFDMDKLMRSPWTDRASLRTMQLDKVSVDDLIVRLETAAPLAEGSHIALFDNERLLSRDGTLADNNLFWTAKGGERTETPRLEYLDCYVLLRMVSVPETFDVAQSEEELAKVAKQCDCLKISLDALELKKIAKRSAPPLPIQQIMEAFCDLLEEPKMEDGWERSRKLVRDENFMERLEGFNISLPVKEYIKILNQITAHVDFEVREHEPWAAINPVRQWFTSLLHYSTAAETHKLRLIASGKQDCCSKKKSCIPCKQK